MIWIKHCNYNVDMWTWLIISHNVVLLSAIQIQLIHKLDSMCDIN